MRPRHLLTRHANSAAAALCAYLLVSLLLFSNTWLHPQSHYIGNPGDPKLYFWALQWPPFAIAHLNNPLFTDYVNYPDGANLAWNTMGLSGVVMWPVTAILGVVASYNALATVSVALSGWTMYLALRRVIGSAAGAAAGGLFYGFSPFMMTQVSVHVVLAMAFIPPLLLLLIYETLGTKRWRPLPAGVAAGVLLGIQLMLFPEMLATEAIGVCVGVGSWMVVTRESIRERMSLALKLGGTVLASFLIVGIPTLAMMFFGRQRLGQGLVHGATGATVYSNDFLNLFRPTGFLTVAPGHDHIPFTGNEAEWTAYLGIPLLVFIGGFAIRSWSHRIVRFAALAAIASAILSLGPYLHINGLVTNVPLPGLLLEHIPLVAGLLPNRLALITDSFVAILIALYVADVVRGSSRSRMRWLRLLPAVIITVSLVPRIPYPSTGFAVPAFFTDNSVKRIPEGSVALVAPFTTNETNVDPQAWQAISEMRFRMPSGYVFVPHGHEVSTGPVLSPLSTAMLLIANGHAIPTAPQDLRTRFEGDLRRWHVKTVIVTPMPHGTEMLAFFRSLLNRSPEHIGGVDVWWNVPY